MPSKKTPRTDYLNSLGLKSDGLLASINVKEGQDVDLSTVLGQIGNTGASTGKHLHFEVSVGSYPVDPIKVIDTAQYVQQAKIQP